MNGLRFSPTFLLLLLFLQTTLHHSSVAQSVYGEYQPDVNTLLLMHFNEVSGDTVHDASANAFVGTANGTTVVSGRFGNARSFNGSSDVINTNYNGNFGTGPFTVEFWVNLNALSSPHQNIIGNRFPQDASTWWIGVYNDGRINVDGGNGGIVSAPGHIVANRWYHIAVTRDAGNTLRVYKNGILVASGTQSGNYNGGTNTSIGAIYNGGEHVNGVIDEVRISNIARSPSEFNLQLPPKNLSANVSATNITLNWLNGGGTVPLMRYRVYRGADSTNVSLIDSTTSTTLSTTAGAAYYFRVSAVDSTGFESEKSAAVFAPLAVSISYWRFNEGSGTTAGDSAGANHGTLSGSPQWVAGVQGTALQFNGTSQYVQVSSGLILGNRNEYTIEAWVKWSGATANPLQTIYAEGDFNDLIALYLHNGKPRLTVLMPTVWESVEDTAALVVGTWYHIAAIVKPGVGGRIYINGQLKATNANIGVTAQTGNTSVIGRFTGNGGDRYFNGVIDEVRISSIALLPSEFLFAFPPTLVGPPHQSINKPIVHLLTWRLMQGVTSYRLQFSQNSDFSPMIVDSTVTDTAFSVGVLSYNTTYYWRVSATTAVGTSEFSETWNFTTTDPVGLTLAEYQFLPSQGTFTPISGTVALSNADISTVNSIPIGFTFRYLGNSYSTVGISADGVMVLGGAFSGSTTFNNLTSGSSRPLLAPLWDDLRVGTLSYKTEGSPPHRIFVVEWLNTSWNYSTSPVISFQVRLYESNGAIEFAYRPEANPVANGSASIGITTTATGSGNFLSLNGTGPNPSVSSTTETTTLNTKPADGQVYAFVPPIVASVPTAPTLSSPTDRATRLPSSVTLSWNISPGASSYYLQVASDAGFSSMRYENTFTSTSATVSGLDSGQTYYWRVRASNSAGQSSFSPTWSFTIKRRPTSFHVSTTGSDANNGSTGSPWRYIQTALGRAERFDTIKVAAGSYSEGLIPQTRVVLRGGYSASFTEQQRDIFNNKTYLLGVSAIIFNDTAGSTIEGFILDAQGVPTTAVIRAGNGTVVRNNIIMRSSQSFVPGVEVMGAALVVNNTIYRCSYGIEISSSGSGTLLVKNNIITNGSWGIVHNASDVPASARPYNNVFGNSFNYTGFVTDPAIGDLSVNPQYRDTSTAVRDFRILESSLCVNAGDPSDPVGDEPEPNGGRIDMGAYGGTKHTPYRSGAVVLPGEYRADVNTILLLHLNETSGTTVSDASSNQNDGTVQGGTVVDGKFGKARSFTTTNEKITVPHSASLNFGTGSYTLEAWINTLNHTNIGGHPHHKRGTGGIGWFTALTTAGEVALAVNNDPNPSGAVGVRKINDGKWHHIAAVITQTTLSIYIDGVLDATAAVNTQGSSDNDGELLLGWQGGSPNPFKGLIDEVRISNIARSPNEFNLQLPPKNLTASTSGGTINLSWQNGGGGVPLMRYRIYQGTDSTNLSKIDSTTATSRSVTNLTPGTRHFFRVTSVDSTGFESVWSFAAHDSLSSDVAAPASPLSPAISPSGWTNTDRFTISWTNPTDESGIAKVWYRVNSAPSTLNPGTSINLLGATSFQITVGAPGTHTIYFYLEDGIGNKNPSSYVTVTAQFDNIKPTVSHDTTGVLSVTVQSGQVIGTLPSITATASRGDSYSPLSSMQLQWRKSNEVGFPRSQSFPGFTNSSIQFNAQQFVTAGKANGVDYRIVVMDAAGNVTMTPTYSISVVVNDPTVSPFNAPAASSLPVSEIVKAYRIFSVPYDLNDKRPSSFLPQSLGDHAENGVPYVRWRFVRVLTDGSLQDYEQFKDLGVVEPGKAFFLIVRKPATIVVGAGKIVKSQVMNDVGISVNAGWNLIGNPLLTNLHADSLTVTSGTIQTRAYFDGAGTSGGWVVNSGKADTLRSWEGLAVRFSQNTTLRFKSIGVQPGVEEERGMPLTVESAVFDPMAKNKGAWSLKLSAFRQDNDMKDEGNLIGMIRPAKRGWDANDWYHPPLVGEKNVALYLMNEDGALMRDLRPVNEEGESWDFNVVTGDAGSRITLRINGPVGDLPPTFRKYLIDLDEKMAYDVDQRESVEMTTKKEGRWFRLVVGTSEYVQKNSRGVELVPSTARIFQNYPNPFNPETIIRYTVPEGASQYRVSLKIFNLLGQEIASLVEEEQLAGYYEAKFHAGRFASGPYFYRLTISDGDRSIFSDVKRMLLVK